MCAVLQRSPCRGNSPVPVLRLLIERLIALGDGDGLVEPDGEQFRRSNFISDAMLLQNTVYAADVRNCNAPVATQCFACFIEGFDEKRFILCS